MALDNGNYALYEATVMLDNGQNSVRVQVYAPTASTAQQMLEAQYGRGNVRFPSRID
jgi:hypothetical protein